MIRLFFLLNNTLSPKMFVMINKQTQFGYITFFSNANKTHLRLIKWRKFTETAVGLTALKPVLKSLTAEQ